MSTIKINTSSHEERQQAIAKEARAWSRLTKQQLQFELARLGLREQTEIYNSLKNGVKKFRGEPSYIFFSFARHGIFLEHGVGRGRPRGSAKAEQLKKVWIKPTLDQKLEILADRLASSYADIIALDMRFLIPGIMDTVITGDGIVDRLNS